MRKISKNAEEKKSASYGATKTNGSSIEKIGTDAFMRAPGLTDAQKNKLTDVMKNTFGESQKIKTEIVNQKVLLFDVITNPDADNADITKIKNKIVDLDKKRLDLMFKSLDEVQRIVEKKPEAGKYLREAVKEKMHASRH